MKKSDVDRIHFLLIKPQDIIIISHTNPDGDAIGSSLALMYYLKGKGHRVKVIIPSTYPDFLAWMPGVDQIHVFHDDRENLSRDLENADIIFCVDFNSADRMEEVMHPFENSGASKVLIDHHVDREAFCDFLYARTNTSSTSELIYDLIEEFGDAAMVNREIAECLFVGIMTDTGSFSYSCDNERTFIVTAELVKRGIDTEHIHRLVYDTYSESRLRLLGFCLSERLTVLPEFATAYIILSREDLERFHHKIGDTEGIVNYTLGIKGIIFGVLIMERDNKIKISLRSKGDFDVNRIARMHFNGGGHRNAAGGDLYYTLDETVQLFRNILPMYAAELARHAAE